MTKACPAKGTPPVDEFMWWLKPRTGLVGNAKHAKCLSILPESTGSKVNGDLRLRSCSFIDTPIYQGFDLYKSTHTSHDECETSLPDQVTVLDLKDVPAFLLKLTGLDEKAKALTDNESAAEGAVSKNLKKWVGKFKDYFTTNAEEIEKNSAAAEAEAAEAEARAQSESESSLSLPTSVKNLDVPMSLDGAKDTAKAALNDQANKLEANTNKGIDVAQGTLKKLAMSYVPKLKLQLGGSVTYGRAYGLALNNDFYKLRADNNYRCSRLPLQAHANKRYGLLAIDLPLTASITAGTGTKKKGVGMKAAASACMIWNMCAKSFAIELSSSLLISMAAGPSVGGKVKGGFGVGVSLTGELERAMDIPLWDGSRPNWVDPEFILRDNGHFWFDFNAELSTPGAFLSGGKKMLRLKLDGDILINVKPRTFSDMTTKYRDFGEGVLLWNGHEDTKTNLLVTLDAEKMRKDSQRSHQKSLMLSMDKQEEMKKEDKEKEKNKKKEESCKTREECLQDCQNICDEYNKECHFISFYFEEDASSVKCNLYRTGNTVKAKKRTKEELAELGYSDPSKLISYFRDPKLIKAKMEDGKPAPAPPTMTDEEREKSETDPQSMITHYMVDGGEGEHQKEAEKSIMDALFTVSAIGKLTLALDLSKQTFGMIDVEITMAAAVAIRAGSKIANPGVYITLDLSADNEVHKDMQKKAFNQLIEGPASVRAIYVSLSVFCFCCFSLCCWLVGCFFFFFLAHFFLSIFSFYFFFLFFFFFFFFLLFLLLLFLSSFSFFFFSFFFFFFYFLLLSSGVQQCLKCCK